MMHGILDFLTSDNAVAVALRRRFLFRVVPMLNPDGVINGNYRCSLSGYTLSPYHFISESVLSPDFFSGHDLNRRWLKPDPALHPEIIAFKVPPSSSKFPNCYLEAWRSFQLFQLFVWISLTRFQNMLDVTARERPLMMFCDLHGHSNKKNMFVYGCAAQYWRPQVIGSLSLLRNCF